MSEERDPEWRCSEFTARAAVLYDAGPGWRNHWWQFWRKRRPVIVLSLE